MLVGPVGAQFELLAESMSDVSHVIAEVVDARADILDVLVAPPTAQCETSDMLAQIPEMPAETPEVAGEVDASGIFCKAASRGGRQSQPL